MPVNKKQLIRLIKLVSELKQNRYPNCESFAKKLKEADLNQNLNIACTAKTVYRDIKTLKDEFNAPIEFDFESNGYYLKHHGWSFESPVLQENQLLSAVFGGKIAEDIIPEPVKSEIKGAVDSQLAVNNPDFLDTAFMESFIIATGVKVNITPWIFKVLFDAWTTHYAVKIQYHSHNGKKSNRIIEPHVIVYYNSVWYIKGICCEKNEDRVFAVHRIEEAEMTSKSFEPNKKIIDSVRTELFGYKKVKDVKIWCALSTARYVLEQNRKPGENVKLNEDGSVIVSFKEIPEHEVIQWVMRECGNIKVLQPNSLAQKVVKSAQKVINLNKKP
jgi:predicted DNA-binding transcriptional regulator YafY